MFNSLAHSFSALAREISTLEEKLVNVNYKETSNVNFDNCTKDILNDVCECRDSDEDDS